LTQQFEDSKERQKRRAERVTKVSGLTVSLDSLYKGEIANLSIHGLFVKTSHLLPVDTMVDVKFLPANTDDKAISIKSKIIWQRKDRFGDAVGMGVEFIEQSRRDKEVISFYIDIVKKENDEKN
jgi:c-di-GMP-binding flagellar brake protein YcgR